MRVPKGRAARRKDDGAMKQTCQDLLDEYRELDALCATLSATQWHQRGPFHGWSAWDEVAHLCYFDETALQAVLDEPAFSAGAAALNDQMARGGQISAVARAHFGPLQGRALLERWRNCYQALVQALSGLDAKARLPWYGPSMSARSFVTARLMETWAHGQDVWDLLPRRRPPSDRLRHIAHIGATTFGWSFANRGLPVPGMPPRVELMAPGGQVWSWGEPGAESSVRGSAEDFCLVVTQRRHVDDTSLQVSGPAARQWMAIAQCFAGPPADGPAPGVRRPRYENP
jgi:uncharacterized protein (TIGR03084 family)